MQLTLLVLGQLDVPFVLAGHGYQFDDVVRDGRGGDESGGGLGLPWILAAVALAAVTVGALVSLDPSGTRRRLRTVGPKVLFMLVIAAPLVAWTASGREDERSLIVERSAGLYGAPELLVSLGDDEVNTLEATDGARAVRLECVDRDGRLVVDAEQQWPFVEEDGFDYPHAHQVATEEQLRRADRCRLLGTSATLDAPVEGALTPSLASRS